MNEQTRLELLKVAATLTAAHGSRHRDDVKKYFEHYCFYLIKNFENIGSIDPKASDDS